MRGTVTDLYYYPDTVLPIRVVCNHVATVNIPQKMAASSVISVKLCLWSVCGCKYIANNRIVVKQTNSNWERLICLILSKLLGTILHANYYTTVMWHFHCKSHWRPYWEVNYGRKGSAGPVLPLWVRYYQFEECGLHTSHTPAFLHMNDVPMWLPWPCCYNVVPACTCSCAVWSTRNWPSAKKISITCLPQWNTSERSLV